MTIYRIKPNKMLLTHDGVFEIVGKSKKGQNLIEVNELFFDDEDDPYKVTQKITLHWTQSELRKMVHDHTGKYFDKIILEES